MFIFGRNFSTWSDTEELIVLLLLLTVVNVQDFLTYFFDKFHKHWTEGNQGKLTSLWPSRGAVKRAEEHSSFHSFEFEYPKAIRNSEINYSIRSQTMRCCVVLVEKEKWFSVAVVQNAPTTCALHVPSSPFKVSQVVMQEIVLHAKTPTASRMMENQCVDPGAVREVEGEVRNDVEFEVKRQNMKREEGRSFMNQSKDKVKLLYHKLAERLDKMSMVFERFLSNARAATHWHVGKTDDRAAFCAICLKDCGMKSTLTPMCAQIMDTTCSTPRLWREPKNWEKIQTIKTFMQGIALESFKVRELVKIEFEKSVAPGSMPTFVPTFTGNTSLRTRRLLGNAAEDLHRAVRDTIVCNYDISPRNSIPENYRLSPLVSWVKQHGWAFQRMPKVGVAVAVTVTVTVNCALCWRLDLSLRLINFIFNGLTCQIVPSWTNAFPDSTLYPFNKVRESRTLFIQCSHNRNRTPHPSMVKRWLSARIPADSFIFPRTITRRQKMGSIRDRATWFYKLIWRPNYLPL